MRLLFSEHAWNDYLYRQRTDKQTLRRINDEHRIVYKVEDDTVFIAQLRYHY